jgi:hypothetical protein
MVQCSWPPALWFKYGCCLPSGGKELTGSSFEVVEPAYQSRPLGKGTIPELIAFKMTSFGKGLLESLQA